jgi:hypothetical protein
MKFPTVCFRFIAMFAGSVFATGLFAQAPKLDIPEPSPTATLKQRVGLTDIEITYSRPGMKGRKIFGALEPFGETWRAGANNATKVVFSTPVKIGGTELPAGTYGLFAVIGKDEWTVIFNKISAQWGAYSYNQKDDVVRVKAKVAAITPAVETFTIDINDIRDESATINLVWENTCVAVPFQVEVVPTVQAQIEAVMASNAEKKPYVPAAMFYLEHHLDLKKAAGWMEAAIAAQPDAFYLVYRLAKIQAAAGDKAAALATAKKSIEGAAKAPPALKDEYTRLNEMLIASLK